MDAEVPARPSFVLHRHYAEGSATIFTVDPGRLRIGTHGTHRVTVVGFFSGTKSAAATLWCDGASPSGHLETDKENERRMTMDQCCVWLLQAVAAASMMNSQPPSKSPRHSYQRHCAG